MTDDHARRIIVTVDEDLADLIPGFLANRQDDVSTMRAALDRRDFRLILLLGHSMKGAGAGYGFDGVSEIGSAVEHAAYDGDVAAVTDAISKLVVYLQSVEVVNNS